MWPLDPPDGFRIQFAEVGDGGRRRCQECGIDLAAEADECPRCGGTPAQYEF
ncbi:MAG: hypothetical protein ABEH56_01375 [Salinirussus sp.]